MLLVAALSALFTVTFYYTGNIIGLGHFAASRRQLNGETEPSSSSGATLSSSQRSMLDELMEALSSERLTRIAETYKNDYAKNPPFPHIAIDGIFPDSVLQELLRENPESWVDPETRCIRDDRARCVKFHKTIDAKGKSLMTNEDGLGPITTIVFTLMKSSNFVQFLQKLTGINHLIPDPNNDGSGIQYSVRGGHLGIHADFNQNRDLKLHRRVNAFIHLNPDWKEEYGGHLELWNRNLTRCENRIITGLGRFVAFTSNDFSYHGFPVPIAAPEGKQCQTCQTHNDIDLRPVCKTNHNPCAVSEKCQLLTHSLSLSALPGKIRPCLPRSRNLLLHQRTTKV